MKVGRFFRAASFGDCETVESFISRGIDVNARDKNGWTPLCQAAANGQCATLKLLIDAGAEVNGRISSDYSALHYAAGIGALESVELLLSCGADVDARMQSGDTPLHGAASAGHLSVVRLLIRSGACPDGSGLRGETPLIRAVRAMPPIRADEPMRRHSFELGPQHDESGVSRLSALFQAELQVIESHRLMMQEAIPQIVRCLMEVGADVTIRDVSGKTALDWAKGGKHAELIQILVAELRV